MTITRTHIVCPRCHEDFSVETNYLTETECPYCGLKITIEREETPCE